MREKEAIEFFNTPKKVYKFLDKVFDKEEICFFIGKSKDNYTIINEDLETLSSSQSVYKCFVGLLHSSYGVGKQNTLPAWATTLEQQEFERDNLLQHVDETIGNVSSIQKIIDQGGLVRYSSFDGENNFAVNMPNEYEFSENLVVKDDSFSEGLSQLDSVLSTLIKAQAPQQ